MNKWIDDHLNGSRKMIMVAFGLLFMVINHHFQLGLDEKWVSVVLLGYMGGNGLEHLADIGKPDVGMTTVKTNITTTSADPDPTQPGTAVPK